MVHSAFDSFELLQDCPTKIDAVASYGSKLLICCSDGSLRLYDSDSTERLNILSQLSNDLRKQPLSLERVVKGFFKKPCLFMEALAERELLLSLSESIAFHRLPNLETFAVITKAKGANVCSWENKRGFLCFARQKRVFIFRHDGGRGFVEVKEFGVLDTVKSMAWCGENICLGIRKEYTILNSTNGVMTEVFPSGRIAPPLVVSLPTGELLLGKENIGVFVDHNGKLLQTERICWSEAPSVVVIQKPYAIGLLPRRVEIRSLRVPYQLIQTIVLQNVRHISQSGSSVVIALENSVFGLFPVPIGAQIVQLTASGNFEEALALCKLLPPEDASLRSAKESSIHIRYAHYLFDNGNYEEAMEHFTASQVDIIYVLSLYPSIILPKTTLIPEPEKVIDTYSDIQHLSRGSSEVSDDIDSFSVQILESDVNAGLESKKMSHNTLMALIKFMQKKRFNVIDKALSEGAVNIVLDAVGDNFDSQDSSRPKRYNKGKGEYAINSGAREMATVLDTALLQALVVTGQPSVCSELLKGHNFCDLKICEDILHKNNYFAALLDLYKCNSMHRDALVLLHRLVVDSEASQTFRPETIIEYLKPLCATDPILVLEFSMYVLETCPTQTIELFLSGNIPADMVNSYLKQHAPTMQGRYLELMLAMNENGISGNLQNEMVQIYLSEVLEWHTEVSSQQKWDEKEYSPSRKKLLNALDNISGYDPFALLKRLPVDALYEERAILLGKMNQHELALSLYVHKLQVPELALSYCDHICESSYKQSTQKPSGHVYLTLLQIYLNPRTTSKNADKKMSSILLSPMPNPPRVPVVAGKSKGGRAAKKIAAIEGAEDIKVNSSTTNYGKSDCDEDEYRVDSNIMLDEVLDLLCRRWDRINGAEALKLLPKETNLQNLLPFLGPLLRKSSETRRNLSVIKGLRESENLKVKAELCNQRRNVVKITGDSLCSLCRKKIGTSVFAVYPNGNTLVHFVCFKDSQRMKAVDRITAPISMVPGTGKLF